MKVMLRMLGNTKYQSSFFAPTYVVKGRDLRRYVAERLYPNSAAEQKTLVVRCYDEAREAYRVMNDNEPLSADHDLSIVIQRSRPVAPLEECVPPQQAIAPADNPEPSRVQSQHQEQHQHQQPEAIAQALVHALAPAHHLQHNLAARPSASPLNRAGAVKRAPPSGEHTTPQPVALVPGSADLSGKRFRAVTAGIGPSGGVEQTAAVGSRHAAASYSSPVPPVPTFGSGCASVGRNGADSTSPTASVGFAAAGVAPADATPVAHASHGAIATGGRSAPPSGAAVAASPAVAAGAAGRLPPPRSEAAAPACVPVIGIVGSFFSGMPDVCEWPLSTLPQQTRASQPGTAAELLRLSELL